MLTTLKRVALAGKRTRAARVASSDADQRAEVTPDGYKLKQNPRPSDKIGGGVGILFKSGTKCKVVSSGELD